MIRRAGFRIIEVTRVLNGNLVALLWVVGAIARTENRACDSHTADWRALSLKKTTQGMRKSCTELTGESESRIERLDVEKRYLT